MDNPVYTKFDINEEYKQYEVMGKLKINAHATFKKHYKNDPKFPKPKWPSKTQPVYSGYELYNYFFKRARKYS
ncbi:unnamed protein product [Fructobacillus cardui]|nr:unnamed protein product [Fructobacillus cardui]